MNWFTPEVNGELISRDSSEMGLPVTKYRIIEAWGNTIRVKVNDPEDPITYVDRASDYPIAYWIYVPPTVTIPFGA